MLPDLKNQTPLNILELIYEYSMTDIFPNICIAIRLYLTLPCTTPHHVSEVLVSSN